MYLSHFAGFRRAALSSLALLSASLSPASWSATVEGLYSAVVEVAGQNVEQRQRGFRLALQTVLSRLTGNREIAAATALQPLLNNAQAHVAQFSYRALEQRVRASATEVPRIAAEAAAEHLLEVNFAPASLNRALGDLGVPLWGAKRPETLLWLAVRESGEPRYILAAASQTDARATLSRAAHTWGLPLLLPLMDLQDQIAADFANASSDVSARVLDASARYGVNIILTGSARQGAAGWVADWSLYHAGRSDNWQARGGQLDNVLETGMQGLAERLAALFSVATNPSQASTIQLRITRVDSLDGYARVLSYLAGLALVKKVSVATVTPEVSYMRLDILGDSDDLRKVIALSPVLRMADGVTGERTEGDPLLHYELMPVP